MTKMRQNQTEESFLYEKCAPARSIVFESLRLHCLLYCFPFSMVECYLLFVHRLPSHPPQPLLIRMYCSRRFKSIWKYGNAA